MITYLPDKPFLETVTLSGTCPAGNFRRIWSISISSCLFIKKIHFSDLVDGVTAGSSRSQPCDPAEVRMLLPRSLCSASPETFSIKSGAFAHFIQGVCSLPQGVRHGSYSPLGSQEEKLLLLISMVPPSRQLPVLGQVTGLGCCSSAGWDAWAPWVSNIPHLQG